MPGKPLKEALTELGMTERTSEFLEAIVIAERAGDTRKLVEFLNGPRIGIGEQRFLALYFQGAFKVQKKRGPSTPESVVLAARLVEQIKKGFKDGGYRFIRGQRHKAAVACAFDFLRDHGLEVPDENALENYMRRSKRNAAR